MKKKCGFSLAEMMVVLLIVAVVLAATAPMITRKVARERSDKIFDMLNTDPTNAVEYIKSRNQRIFMNGKSDGYIGITETGVTIPKNSILFGNSEINDDAVKSVTLGFETKSGKESVTIGYGAQSGTSAISLGLGANASGDYNIAIGNNAKIVKNESHSSLSKQPNYSIAIGYNAKVSGIASNSYSTAIGYNAVANRPHSVVLGTETDTVYIPGNLIVGKATFVGAKSVEDGKAYPLYVQAHHSHDGDGRAITDVINLIEQHWADDYKGGDDWAMAMNGRNQPGVQLGAYEFLAPTSWGGLKDNQKICPPEDSYGNWSRKSSGWCSDSADINKTNTLIYSDMRLKNVGETFNSGLEELNKLKFYHFTFKNDKDKQPHVGVMAQDLEQVFPTSVKKDKDGWLQIRWDEMFYCAINAIKELNLKVIAIGEKLQDFGKDITDLKAKTDKQQTEIEMQAKIITAQQQKLENLSLRIEKLEHRK